LALLFVFSELTINPPEGIIAGPINEENFFEWEALITVCISILHAPGDDPMGYETSAERWSPVQKPNDESGANVDAAKMWREDRVQFNEIAERLVRQTLGLSAS
ncbi:Courtless, partial [Operophtera brumata]